MKKAWGDQGFTVVETMIVLAVTGAMLVSAMVYIGGRQSRVEFSTGVRNFQSSMNDLANDVANGYFAGVAGSGQRVFCTTGVGGAIQISTTSSTNRGCILIGKAVQFAPNQANLGTDSYSTFNLLGRQYIGGSAINGDVDTIDESGVVAIAPASWPNNSIPDATENSKLGGGITVGCVLYADQDAIAEPSKTQPCSSAGAAGLHKTDVVIFMTTFQGVGLNSNRSSGAIYVNTMIPTGEQSSWRTKTAVANTLNSLSTSNTLSTNSTLKGVYICLQSGGTEQHAVIQLGGGSSQFSADAVITQGRCS